MDDHPTDLSSPAEMLPAELARHPDYEIVRRLGGCTMPVFLARNRHIGRHEVLRVIGPEIISRPGVRDHFLREIRSVAKLRHPNIVAAYSGFRAGERLVFAMEYAEGLDLARLVKATGPLSVAHACSFVRQAALGLQQAHRAGLVHRDLRPGNLMLTGKGNRAIVKVLDFGLAKAGREEGALGVFGLAVPGLESPTAEDPRSARQMMSTPDFIAPEQIGNASKADIRADIYSLGCTLYFLLSGKPLFHGPTAHDVLQAQHSMNALPLNLARPDVPAELAALVAKAMSKNPDDRFQTPADLAMALAPFVKNRLTSGAIPSAEDGHPAGPTSALEQTIARDGVNAVAAPSGSTADAETAPWSRLIDINEFEDSPDEDAPDDRPRWSRSFRAGVAGLAATLLVSSIILGVVMQRNRFTEEVVKKPNADAPAKPNHARPQQRSNGQNVDKQRITRSGEQVAKVDRQPKAYTESKPVKPLQPTPVATPEPKMEPPVVSMPDRPAPVARPPVARPTAPRTPREIANFRASAPVIQARLLFDKARVVYESGGSAPGLFVGDLHDPKNPHKLVGHPTAWKQLSFAADGRAALSLNEDRTLSAWNLENQASRPVRTRYAAGINRIALAPDGRRALYFVGGAIHVRDMVTNRDKEQGGRFDSGIVQVAFCPDGKRIVTAHLDHTIRHLSLENSRESPPMAAPGEVTDLAVFPEGQRVMASSSDGTVGVWDLKTGAKLREIVVAANGRFGEKDRETVIAPGGVVAASLSPDGHRALFASGNLFFLWDLETDEELNRVQHDEQVVDVRFSPDGGCAVSAAGAVVRVWELPPGRKSGEQPPLVEVAHYLGEERGGADSVAVTPDGLRIVTSGWPERIRVFDRVTGQFTRYDNIGGGALAIAPDGRHVLSAHGSRVLKLWDLESGQVGHEFHGHTEIIFSVAFSPDGRLAYSTSGGKEMYVDGSDSDIRIWDLAETGGQVGTLTGHQGIVRCVAVSRDGRRVLSGGWSDKTVILWDALSGQLVRRLEGHIDAVSCVAFLPDGRRAVSCSSDSTVLLWDLATGVELHRFQAAHGLGWLAVSPDGRRLLTASFWGRELRLWDLEAKKQITRIDFGGVPPHRGCFTPDGRHAVWAGNDGIVRMYRLNALEPANRPATPAGAPERAPSSKRQRDVPDAQTRSRETRAAAP
jgi:WD40 repeat protein/serine/threonine protein kinase